MQGVNRCFDVGAGDLKECAGIDDDFTGVLNPAHSSSSTIRPGVLTSHEMCTSLDTEAFTGVLRRLEREAGGCIGELLIEKWGLKAGEK